MPYSGSDGTYTLSDTIAPATLADANELQAILNDIQTAFTAAFCKDGESTLSGAIKGFDGTVSLPGYSFSGDLDSGLYRIGANNIGLTLGGSKVVDYATTGVSVTGTLGGSGNFAIATSKFTVAAASGNTVIAGTATITGDVAVNTNKFTVTASSGNTVVAGTLAVTGNPSFTSTDAMAMVNGTTGQRSTTTEGSTRYNSTLHGLEFHNGTAWMTLAQAPTVQKFTSGSAQTYTPATGVARIRVRMCGGGGGGGARTTNVGTAGADTSFGTWTAIHGAGGAVGSTGAGGAGGTGGVDGTGTLIVRMSGADGGASAMLTDASGDSQASFVGGYGGSSMFGGAGAAAATTGGAAKTNTGSGGAGGVSSVATRGGGGGGAAEYVEFWVNNPGATTYTVGAKGTGGAAGGSAGGDGAAGIIVIEEFYA